MSNFKSIESEAYKAGLHLISEFTVQNSEVLKDVGMVRIFFDKIISDNNLSKVGEVYHQFPESGYTAVICITESHISIHTWPEYNRVTFDVFLSNYMNINNEIAEKIHSKLLLLLGATEVNTTRLNR